MARRIARQAPVGGWNTRDAEDDLKPEDAVILENWFPDRGAVKVRKGYSSYATGLGGEVNTLFEFHAGSIRYFIGAANNKLWNITTSTAVDITGSATITSDRWQHAQMDDALGGARVALVNGVDAPLVITSGPTVSALTITGSGLTASNLIGVNVFKNRSYFWAANSQDFWYSSTNALGGTVTKFPLGRVDGTGGNLVAMQTWTVDGGNGIDDLAVFFFSSGSVFVYQGDDPGDNWALVGRYQLGEAINIRGFAQYAGDLIAITREGYIPVSANLFTAQSQTVAISDKINSEAQSVVNDYATNQGWQSILYPKGRMLIVNIPISSSLFEQHVMNTQTRAWCKFTGINSRCWGVYNNNIYFGGSGTVFKFDDTYQDNGSAIKADGLTAWDYFGDRATEKIVTMVRPVLKSASSSLTYGVRVVSDFDRKSRPTASGSASVSNTPWGSPWGSPWGARDHIIKDWFDAEAVGGNAAVRMQINPVANQDVSWLSTDYVVEKAGAL